MTRIAFIRHGVTQWNKAGRAQGSSDIPLDTEGWLQAEKIAKRLANDDWDIIFSSDLSRARQTAEAIQSELETVPLKLDARLREVSVGKAEGTTLDERIAKWGENWRALDLGGETHEYVLKRGWSFLEEITENDADDNMIVVSHGSFIKRMLNKLLPHVDMEFSIENCSLTVVRKANANWELELHNCTKHLYIEGKC